MSRVQDTLTEWAFSAGWHLVRRVPERVAMSAFMAMADRTWRGRGPSVRQLERNLQRVRPHFTEEQLRELSREGVRRYMRYWCEAFRLPSWSGEAIDHGFDLAGVEVLDKAARSGSGAMVVGAHMGNWDLAGAWGARRYGTVVTVVERLKPEGLFEQFLDYRRALGLDVHGTGEPDLVPTLVRAARAGKVVALVGDRDLSGRGIEVEFFGERALFPAGPALISLLSGAPLIPLTNWYEGARLCGRVHDPIPVPEGVDRDTAVRLMTQQMARALEEGIAAHPEDWHMMQRLWPADRRTPA